MLSPRLAALEIGDQTHKNALVALIGTNPVKRLAPNSEELLQKFTHLITEIKFKTD